MVDNRIASDHDFKALKIGFCKGLVAFSLISLLSFSSVYTLPRSAEAQSTEDFETYVNREHGIIIQHPADWEVDEEPSTGIVEFGHPSDFANVLIFVDNLTPNNITTLDEYEKEIIRVYEGFTEDLEVVEKGKTTLSGLSAQSITFTGKIKAQDATIDVKVLQVFTIKESKGYRIQ